MMNRESYRPTESDRFWGLPQRGDGRGLGKPIRINGSWSGQSRCDIIGGKPVFRRFDVNGNEISTNWRNR